MKKETNLDYSEFKVNGEDSLAWNIVGGGTYQRIIETVFEKVAEKVGFTIGPYGNKTIIDKQGKIIMTKDGYNVVKSIAFNNPVYNSVITFLHNAASAVVTRVGDGSSTCIVSADKLYKHLKENDALSKLRAKDLEDLINQAIDDITEYILSKSIKIEEDSNFDKIWNIAYISTDSNKEYADMIMDIYDKTHNPSIEYSFSKSNKTKYEVIDGFMGYGTYLDRIYITSDDGLCDIKNPAILCFNYKINAEDYELFIQPAIRAALNQNRRLVVFAPYYDALFLQSIAKLANQELRASGTTSCVYCRTPISSSSFAENFDDFAMMCNCEMISESVADDFKEKYKYENGKLTETIKPERTDVTPLIGGVDQISIASDKTVISGFSERNADQYKLAVENAASVYNELKNKSMESGIVTNKLFDAKKRLSRLRGNIGIIHVGGANELEKNANYDAIDDAVKACESAYNYGYNIGCSMIIPIACKELINKENASAEMKELLSLISMSMKDVYAEVLSKYYSRDEDKEAIKNIIEESFEKKAPYDLIKKEYSDEVINPCRTDIEVLRASGALISVLLSSNQYLTIMADEQVY